MNEDIKKFFSVEALELPAKEEELREAEAKLGVCFPVQYREFMLTSNGAEGRDAQPCGNTFDEFLQQQYDAK